jgi:uncharacterized protein (DUF934 family)
MRIDPSGSPALPHLPLVDWQAQRAAAGGAPQACAVLLPNDADPSVLADDVPHLAAVALQFPKWTDGRAYSQAWLLRARLGFRGEVRAVGDVVVDMLPLLRRTGFSAATLREGQSRETALRTLRDFDDAFGAGFYQADAAASAASSEAIAAASPPGP